MKMIGIYRAEDSLDRFSLLCLVEEMLGTVEKIIITYDMVKDVYGLFTDGWTVHIHKECEEDSG